jgi:hypothetical protein
MKASILEAVEDLVLDFLVYDRQEDEDLPEGAIENALDKGDITEEEIVNKFKECLRESL